MNQKFTVVLLLALAAIFSRAERVPWTGSRIQGSPEKAAKYRLERMVPDLALNSPVDLAWNKELRCWFIAEQNGRILTANAEGRNVHLAADFGPRQGRDGACYGIAFDPGFATNRAIYVCYVLKPELPDGSHVSRFTVRGNERPEIDFGSEESIITWLSGGHNGGCLKFGLDGYLYISTGDGGGPNPPDPLRTGQDVSDLLSSILRVDVHKKSGGKNYAIPADNPFVNDPKARPEIWCYGVRNPWRMGFDQRTGDLWVADVGFELWELIYRVQKGANYGWSIVEGRQPIVAAQPHGPGPIIPPIKDHAHSEAASITGGYVYYGSQFPELNGAFIYGDWETGKIWGLRADRDGKVTYSEELLDSSIRVVSFAEDPNGEIAVLDYNGGIYSLRRNSAASRPEDFPVKLSQTGLFRSTEKNEIAPGIAPFNVNAAMWNDYASARRFVALPVLSKIEAAQRPWRFPSNAVLVRTVSMEMERGNPASSRRLETQILHFNGDGWNAYTYRWNNAQTDADLVPAEGAEETLTVSDSARPGGKRVQLWRYHARAECLRCHNPWCGTALGFQPEQLAGHLDELSDFFKALPREKVVAHVSPYTENGDPAARARSWLHVNCSQCHRNGAGGSVPSFMNSDSPLEELHLVGARPVRGDLGLKEARVVAAGEPFSSVLLFRTSSSGRSRMPYIGSHEVDEAGTALLRDWIESLDSAQGRRAADDLSRLREELSSPGADLEKIAAGRLAESSAALELAHAAAHSSVSPSVKLRLAHLAVKSPNPLVRELFDRFLPADERVPVSSAMAPREQVLAMKGDARRGAALLTDSARVTCLQCHQFQNRGRVFGPPFKQAAHNKTKAELFDNITEPSRQIAPEYVMYTAELRDDEPLSGIIIRRSADHITLRDSGSADHELAMSAVQSLKPQQLSAMPEGLLAGLTAQEVSDLIEALLAEASE